MRTGIPDEPDNEAMGVSVEGRLPKNKGGRAEPAVASLGLGSRDGGRFEVLP
ncbi:hypothetical protein SDC9_206719 [bioreactor metagenome]|uniref:Uncharacterized protein n=1 Tax=bioreactor metagenome TaxID=1076179 RepID=A0A645J795_9ZZZZ